MNFEEKDVRKISIIVLVAILAVLVFLLLKPVIIAILGGLILAYICTPVYRKLLNLVRNRTLAATLVTLIIVLVIVLVVWLLVPLIAQQVFQVFDQTQKVDVQNLVKSIFPKANQQFVVQISVTINSLLGKVSSLVINSLINVILDLPKILLDLFIIAFVFFFAMRDSDKLKEFVKGLSPLSESREKVLIDHFKGITESIIYGQVIVGIVQGLLAGLGFMLFGVPNAIILTILAIFFSIIPFVGPGIIWVPVTIYLFGTGDKGPATLYLLYNILIVSIVDNIIRSYIISKKSKLSPAVALVGMLGGLFVFGLLGLIIGPLILAYLITFLESFKDKSAYSLFSK